VATDAPTGSTSESPAGRAGAAQLPCTDGPAPLIRRAGRPRDARASGAIAAAARRQLADVGYANMSMESVAAEAGVGRATIYRRYRDKADLVTSAIAADIEAPATTTEPLEDLVAYLERLEAGLAESCLEVVGTLLACRAAPSAMALHRDRVVRPTKAAVAELAARAIRAGLLRPRTDPELLTEMLVGAVFARRVAGVRSEPGWARRAVESACVGAATPSGLARLGTSAGRRPRDHAPASPARRPRLSGG